MKFFLKRRLVLVLVLLLPTMAVGGQTVADSAGLSSNPQPLRAMPIEIPEMSPLPLPSTRDSYGAGEVQPAPEDKAITISCNDTCTVYYIDGAPILCKGNYEQPPVIIQVEFLRFRGTPVDFAGRNLFQTQAFTPEDWPHLARLYEKSASPLPPNPFQRREAYTVAR